MAIGVGTALGIGASVLGSAMSAGAAGDAASAQVAGTNAGIQEQRAAREQVAGFLAPYRDAGTSVLYGNTGYDNDAYDQALADFYALDPLGTTTKTGKPGKNGAPGKTSTKKGSGFLTLAQYQALPPDQRTQYERDSKGNFIRKAPKLEDFKKAPDQNSLLSLVTDPNAQKNFISNNPFFDSLAQRSTDTLFANQAARGKVGSGGTAEALQNSLLLLGSDLLNQSIQQRQTIANMGASAAGNTAQATQNSANAISDLYGQRGNAQAAGAIGQANAWMSGAGQIAKLGMGSGGGSTYYPNSGVTVNWNNPLGG